jgi:hypothetical protein
MTVLVAIGGFARIPAFTLGVSGFFFGPKIFTITHNGRLSTARFPPPIATRQCCLLGWRSSAEFLYRLAVNERTAEFGEHELCAPLWRVTVENMPDGR